MEITSSSPYPYYLLSSFSDHPFELDGVRIRSMESFLQALKFTNSDSQKGICMMSGLEAKLAGEEKREWTSHLELWWNGRPYRRFNAEYNSLLDRAYWTMMQANPGFKSALLATGAEVLTQSGGPRYRTRSTMTRAEFTRSLTRLRETLKPDLLNQDIQATISVEKSLGSIFRPGRRISP